MNNNTETTSWIKKSTKILDSKVDKTIKIGILLYNISNESDQLKKSIMESMFVAGLY